MTQNTPLPEHPAHIEVLRKELKHSIVVIESAHPIENYTCAVHAFHLIDDPTYLRIADFGLGKTFAGSEFIAFLLEHQLLVPRDGCSIIRDDLIIYLDNGSFKHVGRIHSPARMLSKWGKGYFYEHGVWEVPSNYGEEMRFFSGPDECESFELFIEYAKSKGFSFR
jgi:hypothetical protein